LLEDVEASSESTITSNEVCLFEQHFRGSDTKILLVAQKYTEIIIIITI